MKLLLILSFLMTMKAQAQTTPVSYREQTTAAQVLEDKVTALDNIKSNFKEYCEWQSLDKNLYRIQERDNSALSISNQLDQEFENPFKIEDYIEKYRTAKSENSLVKARDIFHNNATLRPGLSLLYYSQLGSHQLQELYRPYWNINPMYRGDDNFVYFKSILKDLTLTIPLHHDYKDLHTEEFIPTNHRFKRMNLSGKSLQILGLCTYISLLNGVSCKNAIIDNEDLFSPKFYSIKKEDRIDQTASITATPIFKEVLYGKNYTEVLRKSALDFIDLIVNDSSSKDTNAYDIIFNNFKKIGLSEFEAKSKAINIMATISTGGGSFWARLLDRESIIHFNDRCLESCNINSVYLVSIVNSIIFLDHLKIKKFGNTFSFPKEIDYECNMGDWYHFWMAAALSRRMNIRGYNRTISKLSTFVMSVGYHVHAGHLLTKQKFGTILNSANQDLLLSSLGIRFGLDETSGKKVFYSSMLQFYLKQMNTTPPISKESLSSLTSTQRGLQSAQLLGIRYLFDSIINLE